MLLRKIAINYAKALFAVSGSQVEIQRRQAGLEHLAAVIRDQPPLLQLLCYPELSVEDRLKAVEKLLKLDLDPVLRRFLDILLKKRRANYLIAIASEYHKLVVNELKILDVEVQSPEPLSEATRKELLLKLENKFKKKINLIETIDVKLICGFVLLIGNKLIDFSIKSKLTKIKKLTLK